MKGETEEENSRKKKSDVQEHCSTALYINKLNISVNIIVILNPKHSTVPAARKKINSILAESRAMCHILFLDSQVRIAKVVLDYIKVYIYIFGNRNM